MLVKSIIAGTVLTLMAGGVVYFGTDVSADNVAAVTENVKTKLAETTKTDTNDTSADHPHKDTPKKVKTPPGTTISAKKVTVKTAAPRAELQVDSDDAVTPEKTALSPDQKSQKKWLDQYLKTETPEMNAPKAKTKAVIRKMKKAEVDSREPSIQGQMTKERTQDMKAEAYKSYGSGTGASDKDTGTFIVEGDNVEIDVLTDQDIEMAEEKGFKKRLAETENIWVEKGGTKKAERKMLHDIIKKESALFEGTGKDGRKKKIRVKVLNTDEPFTTIETETIDMGDGKTIKIVKKSTMDDKIEVKKDISQTVDLIMAETKKIKMPELRDRAYLDLVTYTLQNGDYDAADTALSMIKQVELRDTARNRISVAYAKDGDAEKAFAVIEDIEVEALRDVMRLQVIEAMIAPEELPKDLQ